MRAVAGASSLTGPGVAVRASRPLVGTAAAPLALGRDPLRMALFVLTILTISRVHQHYPVLAKFRPIPSGRYGAGLVSPTAGAT
jgi:hypothetical protein